MLVCLATQSQKWQFGKFKNKVSHSGNFWTVFRTQIFHDFYSTKFCSDGLREHEAILDKLISITRDNKGETNMILA